jgi:hypothetical protein
VLDGKNEVFVGNCELLLVALLASSGIMLQTVEPAMGI